MSSINRQHNDDGKFEISFRGQKLHFDAAQNIILSLSNVTALDLSYNFIDRFPHLLPSNLVALNISANNISVLWTSPSVENLVELNLSSNQLESVAELNKARSLKFLDLSNNRLKDTDGLETLISLKVLNLDNNQIFSFMSLRSISFSRSLEKLNLAGNPIMNMKNLKFKITANIPSLRKLNNVSIRARASLQSAYINDHLQYAELHNNRTTTPRQPPTLPEEYTLQMTEESKWMADETGGGYDMSVTGGNDGFSVVQGEYHSTAPPPMLQYQQAQMQPQQQQQWYGGGGGGGRDDAMSVYTSGQQSVYSTTTGQGGGVGGGSFRGQQSKQAKKTSIPWRNPPNPAPRPWKGKPLFSEPPQQQQQRGSINAYDTSPINYYKKLLAEGTYVRGEVNDPHESRLIAAELEKLTMSTTDSAARSTWMSPALCKRQNSAVHDQILAAQVAQQQANQLMQEFYAEMSGGESSPDRYAANNSPGGGGGLYSPAITDGGYSGGGGYGAAAGGGGAGGGYLQQFMGQSSSPDNKTTAGAAATVAIGRFSNPPSPERIKKPTSPVHMTRSAALKVRKDVLKEQVERRNQRAFRLDILSGRALHNYSAPSSPEIKQMRRAEVHERISRSGDIFHQPLGMEDHYLNAYGFPVKRSEKPPAAGAAQLHQQQQDQNAHGAVGGKAQQQQRQQQQQEEEEQPESPYKRMNRIRSQLGNGSTASSPDSYEAMVAKHERQSASHHHNHHSASGAAAFRAHGQQQQHAPSRTSSGRDLHQYSAGGGSGGYSSHAAPPAPQQQHEHHDNYKYLKDLESEQTLEELYTASNHNNDVGGGAGGSYAEQMMAMAEQQQNQHAHMQHSERISHGAAHHSSDHHSGHHSSHAVVPRPPRAATSRPSPPALPAANSHDLAVLSDTASIGSNTTNTTLEGYASQLNNIAEGMEMLANGGGSSDRYDTLAMKLQLLEQHMRVPYLTTAGGVSGSGSGERHHKHKKKHHHHHHHSSRHTVSADDASSDATSSPLALPVEMGDQLHVLNAQRNAILHGIPPSSSMEAAYNGSLSFSHDGFASIAASTAGGAAAASVAAASVPARVGDVSSDSVAAAVEQLKIKKIKSIEHMSHTSTHTAHTPHSAEYHQGTAASGTAGAGAVMQSSVSLSGGASSSSAAEDVVASLKELNEKRAALVASTNNKMI